MKKRFRIASFFFSREFLTEMSSRIYRNVSKCRHCRFCISVGTDIDDRNIDGKVSVRMVTTDKMAGTAINRASTTDAQGDVRGRGAQPA
jgi:hypothetical protein